MAEGVLTNNQRGRRAGPCRLWGGLDKARHIVPTALLVRVQCFRKGLYKAVEGPNTRLIALLMINGSYCRRLRRLTIFEPDEMKLLTNPKIFCTVTFISFHDAFSTQAGDWPPMIVKTGSQCYTFHAVGNQF